MTICKHEWKVNIKSLLIWALSVGGICLICILVYDSMRDSLDGISESFANMGSFSEALGLDKVSIATMNGYYATEIAIMIALGGAMFAAITGAGLVAKEEEGHTSEFLMTFPVGRTKILIQKYVAMIFLILVFNAICIALSALGFLIMGAEIDTKCLLLYHLAQVVMHMEIGSISFLISCITNKKPIGACLGLAVILYVFDLMCRIVPALKWLKYVTPYFFSNGTEIFTTEKINLSMLFLSLGISIAALLISLVCYNKRDLR